MCVCVCVCVCARVSVCVSTLFLRACNAPPSIQLPGKVATGYCGVATLIQAKHARWSERYHCSILLELLLNSSNVNTILRATTKITIFGRRVFRAF